MSEHHVEPGGEPLTFDLGAGLTCTKVSLGLMDNNGYLLVGEAGPAVWIDAAAEADRIVDVLEGAGVSQARLTTVITSHRHHDHIKATAQVMSATGAVGICGEPDRQAIERATGTIQRGVWDGDRIQVGSGSMEVIGLVGHTAGSITLVWESATGPVQLFTGDSLFPGGPGKTSDQRDFASLMDDLERKIFDRFGDDALVHPGHGDATTLGAERPHLAKWRARGW